MSNARPVLLAAMALTLAGCTTLEERLRAGLGQADVAAEAAKLDAPEDWVAGDADDAAIATSWSVIVDDPTLLALIDEALANSPSLRASAEAVARSQALLRQARASRLPSLDASLAATTSSPLEDVEFDERFTSALTAGWEADLWGRIGDGIAAAEFDAASASAFFRSARQALIAQVARTYVSAIESERQRALAQATRDATAATLAIVETRYDLGFAGKRELVLAQSDLASANDNLAVAEADVRATARALEVLLGRYPAAEIATPQAFPAFADAIVAGQPADVLRRRPDVVSAEFDVRQAFAQLDATRAGRWPALTLSSNLNGASTDLDELFDPVSLAFSVGARLANSLFDGGLTKGRIEAAEAGGRQALANYGQTVLDAFADVEGRLDDIAVLEARQAFVQEAADAARETLRLAEIQYAEGAIDLLDVLTFRQRAFQADRTLLAVQRQALDARVALYLAIGADADPADFTAAARKAALAPLAGPRED